MSEKENPPAFPSGDKAAFPTATFEAGMTLRDYFAGQAVIHLATLNHGNDWGANGVEHGKITARKAYAIADAMLAQRSQPND